MQIRHEQLVSQLQKQLAPIYLISGDVPLLMLEACDAIRAAARQQDYIEREVFQVETGFVWQNLSTAADTMSLFSSKQIIELRCPSNTLGDAGSKALQAYAAKLPSDKILLISMGKLDARQQQSVWFQTLLKVGVVVQIWPLETAQLPQWITQRLAAADLKADPAGVQLLADRAEGNLLAAAQEIEKLRLSYGAGILTTDAIADAVSDSARFDVFGLSDAILQGNAKRVLRILYNLQAEGIEATLVLWAITRELRSLATMAYAVAQGDAMERVMQQQRVWEKRKPLFRAALARHSLATWRKLIQRAQLIDRVIKGLELGNVWDELSRLTFIMARRG